MTSTGLCPTLLAEAKSAGTRKYPNCPSASSSPSHLTSPHQSPSQLPLSLTVEYLQAISFSKMDFLDDIKVPLLSRMASPDRNQISGDIEAAAPAINSSVQQRRSTSPEAGDPPLTTPERRRTTIPDNATNSDDKWAWVRPALLAVLRFLVRNLWWLSCLLPFIVYASLNAYSQDWECCRRNLAAWFSSAPAGLASGISGGYCFLESENWLAGFTFKERVGFCGSVAGIVGTTVASQSFLKVRDSCAHVVCQ